MSVKSRILLSLAVVWGAGVFYYYDYGSSLTVDDVLRIILAPIAVLWAVSELISRKIQRMLAKKAPEPSAINTKKVKTPTPTELYEMDSLRQEQEMLLADRKKEIKDISKNEWKKL